VELVLVKLSRYFHLGVGVVFGWFFGMVCVGEFRVVVDLVVQVILVRAFVSESWLGGVRIWVSEVIGTRL